MTWLIRRLFASRVASTRPLRRAIPRELRDGAKPPARLARRFPPLRAPRVRARPATNGRTTVSPPRTAATRTLRERAATARSRSMRRTWFPALLLAAPCLRFGTNTATDRLHRDRIVAEAQQRFRRARHTQPAVGR